MAYPPQHDRQTSYGYGQPMSPPMPPPPPDLRVTEEPMLAPRPHRVDPSVPHNMMNHLDEQSYNQPSYDYRRPSPAPNHNLGFAVNPPPRQYSPLPPPQGAAWSPWLPAAANMNGPAPYGQPPPSSYRGGRDSIAQSMANLSLSPAMSPPAPGNPYGRPQSVAQSPPIPRAPSAAPPAPGAAGSLTAAIPTIPALTTAMPTIQQPNHDPALKIAWARDVLSLVDRLHQPLTAVDSASSTATGPIIISDPQLLRLVQVAVPTVLQVAALGTQAPMPTYVAEAVYLRATFAASGAYPEHVKLNPRQAFRDYEASARAGHHIAWFKIGRDYENFKDIPHAKECFERGLRYGVESCIYRIGMAHLLGQLGFSPSMETALPLLLRAANMSSLITPQPAYVYALILLGEFNAIPDSIPSHLLTALIPPSSSPSLEARKHLERSAYLHFAPAQYKLGHAYEFAIPPFEFDPLLSVEWYSKASQQGEAEADMALSKWFLCGAENSFEKDEGLAYIFAEKAASRGLASAEFAMGYYCEVGIGRPGAVKDIPKAVSWYEKAKSHGNTDAIERLQALQTSTAASLSRQEHDAITENKLVRTRTQARQKSEAAGAQPMRPAEDSRKVMEVIRENTINMPAPTPPTNARMSPPMTPMNGGYAPASSMPSAPQNPQVQALRPQQLPQAQRYSLVDPGTTPPSSRPGSSSANGPVPTYGGRRASAQQSPERAASPYQPKKAGPTTFAEMGIPSAKAEDKECIIM